MKSRRENGKRRRFLGQVVVDSGMIMMTDPCLVLDDEDYERICEGLRESETLAATFNNDSLVVADTVIGDGVYPVYLVLDKNGEPARFEIVIKSAK